MAKGSLKKLAGMRELGIAVVIAIGGGLYFKNSLIAPQTQSNREIKKKIGELKTEKKSLEEFVAAIKKPEEGDALATLKTSTDMRTQLLTGERKVAFSDIATFFATLSSPGFKEGVLIDSVFHGAKAGGSGYEIVPYNLIAHGPFAQVLSLIDKISKLEALVLISNVSLSIYIDPERKVARELMINLETDGKLYKLTGGGTAPAPATASSAPAP